jgi:hypothetical protein
LVGLPESAMVDESWFLTCPHLPTMFHHGHISPRGSIMGLLVAAIQIRSLTPSTLSSCMYCLCVYVYVCLRFSIWKYERARYIDMRMCVCISTLWYRCIICQKQNNALAQLRCSTRPNNVARVCSWGYPEVFLRKRRKTTRNVSN